MEKEIRIERFEDILTKRPEGMSYEDYRIKRKEQQMKLRGYNIVNTNPLTCKAMPKIHIMGRLEGVVIPSEEWTNSRDYRRVIV